MNRPIRILLVDDDPGDVRLTREAIRECRISTDLTVVGDGAAAVDYLETVSHQGSSTIPDLVLLDLNLPKLSGREVLQRIKADLSWKTIPVIVLTTSNAESDIHDCYDKHANCYITKPLAFEAFMDVMRRIEDFWLAVVQLPGAGSDR